MRCVKLEIYVKFAVFRHDRTQYGTIRDEHGSGLDRIGSGLRPIFAGSGLDRTAIFFKTGGSGLDRIEKIFVVLM